MPLRPNMEPGDFLWIFLRRKWLIIFSLLIVLFAGSVYCVVTPEMFKSSTTILVVPQRVPESYVRSTVSIRIEDRLATLQQQIMSRTRLTTVINELGLFPELRKTMPTEDLVNNMRQRIDVQVVTGKDAFTISFLHENPQVAMLTTARLASFFIDENLKSREQQAVGTSEFLASQLKETKDALERQEDKVKQYKMRFMGELPQQMEANLARLRGLQDRLRANADSIRAAENRRIFLESQLASVRQSVQTFASDNGSTGQLLYQDSLQNMLQELNVKRAKLSDLSGRYTEQYPEIKQLKEEIANLEKRIASVQTSPNPVDGLAGNLSLKSQTIMNSPEYQEIRRLDAQIGAADLEIKNLKRENEEINKTIYELQAKVERSPRREQEMIALMRDYDNLKQSYDDLLKKRLEADISQNLEKRQKGEQFQVLDPANLPTTPFKPDRGKIMAISFLLACAIGFGGAIGIEAMDSTLRNEQEFRHFFNLPVLACIPVLSDREYVRRARIRTLLVMGGFLSIVTGVAVFLFFYADKVRSIISF